MVWLLWLRYFIYRFKSYDIGDKRDNEPIVYIGEWEYEEQLKQDIRLIKRQSLKYGQIIPTYETKDEKNKDIEPIPLTLIREDNTLLTGKNISKEENDRIIEELRAKGYVIEE